MAPPLFCSYEVAQGPGSFAVSLRASVSGLPAAFGRACNVCVGGGANEKSTRKDRQGFRKAGNRLCSIRPLLAIAFSLPSHTLLLGAGFGGERPGWDNTDWMKHGVRTPQGLSTDQEVGWREPGFSIDRVSYRRRNTLHATRRPARHAVLVTVMLNEPMYRAQRASQCTGSRRSPGCSIPTYLQAQ